MMNRWLGEGGGGLTAYHTNLQVNSNQQHLHNNTNHLKSNSYHGEHFVNADLFNVSCWICTASDVNDSFFCLNRKQCDFFAADHEKRLIRLFCFGFMLRTAKFERFDIE
jgi:hypothetical protein